MESCTSVFYREINWPNTPIDKMAKSQCPLDTRGEAFRMCLPSGLWALERDLSGCVSAAFHDLQEQFRDIWSGGYMVTIELIEDVHRFIQTAHLFGGDLIETSRLLYQINKHNSAFTSAYNRKQLSETAKVRKYSHRLPRFSGYFPNHKRYLPNQSSRGVVGPSRQ